MKEDYAFKMLKPFLPKLAHGVVRGFEVYRKKYPHRPIHRRTTSANVICDEIWAEVVNVFCDDAPRVKPIMQHHGLRLLGIQGTTAETEILLWFKKVDRSRRPHSLPTERSKKMLRGDTLEMFESATTLVVGYHLNREENRIRTVSISRLLDSKIEWSFELDLPDDGNLVQLPETSPQAPSATRVVIRRVEQKRLDNDA
jgi:hypothetical protein